MVNGYPCSQLDIVAIAVLVVVIVVVVVMDAGQQMRPEQIALARMVLPACRCHHNRVAAASIRAPWPTFWGRSHMAGYELFLAADSWLSQ